MKIFCSWSGDYSREVAAAVGDWIPLVLQHTSVFFSDHVLDPGDRWLSVVSDALDKYDFGLIFVSKNNLERPWLLFEAGALAKSVSQARVVPILLNLEPSDLLANPLSQFQSILLDRENIKSVLRLILRESETALISSEQLEQIFETWWPTLEENLSKIKPEKVQPSKVPSTDDRLGKLEKVIFDVLREVRNQSAYQNFGGTSLGTGLFGNPIRHGYGGVAVGAAFADEVSRANAERARLGGLLGTSSHDDGQSSAASGSNKHDNKES